jgi:hypothetical protein
MHRKRAMTAIYIVDYLRSPFTPAYRGALPIYVRTISSPG